MEGKTEEETLVEAAQKERGDMDVCIKEEGKVSSEAAGTPGKRLLTMAGLFDHWQAPKVSIIIMICDHLNLFFGIP